MSANSLTVTPLGGIPRVKAGDDLACLLISAIERSGLGLQPTDIIVVAQKIVSKAEGRVRALATARVTDEAEKLSGITGKDPRQIALVLEESTEILRAKKNVIVVAHRLGLVMANAGIDRSNVEQGADGESVLLLPLDPDQSAAEIRQRLAAHFGVEPGIVITDSIGRAWRLGTVGHAIGAAGVPSIIDQRGQPDMNNRALEVTETAFADSVAAAAVLVMGEAAEGTPAAIVRGLTWTAPERPARALVRPKAEDMFR